MMTQTHRALPVLALLIGGLLFLATGGTVHAQSGMHSVGAVATGGGTSALDSGPAALYSNPANLTVGSTAHPFEVQLFRMGGYFGGDFFQFNHITPLFYENEEALPPDEQKAILDDWFGDKMRSASQYVEVVPFSITYRPSGAPWAAGFGIRGRVIQTSAINKGPYEVLLPGTDQPIPIDGRTRLYGSLDLTGSFSYRFSSLPLSIGGSPRIILGTGFADATLDSRAVVSSDSLVHNFDYTARATGALSTGLYDTLDLFSADPVPEVTGSSVGISGTGLGIDLGATYTIQTDLHVSASMTDLGFIRWTRDAQRVTPANNSFRFEGVPLKLDQLSSEYDGDLSAYVEDQVDSLARAAYEDVERDRSAFATGLPTTLHLNGTWAPPVELADWAELTSVNGGVSIGLNERAGAVPDPAAVHVGGRMDLGPVPIRAGFRFWGTQAMTLSGGIGLNARSYRFDLGVSITPSTSALGGGARYAVSFSLATIQF